MSSTTMVLLPVPQKLTMRMFFVSKGCPFLLPSLVYLAVLSLSTICFFVGLILVFGVAFTLYELHLRVPLLRFLFSGKPQRKA